MTKLNRLSKGGVRRGVIGCSASVEMDFSMIYRTIVGYEVEVKDIRTKVEVRTMEI